MRCAFCNNVDCLWRTDKCIQGLCVSYVLIMRRSRLCFICQHVHDQRLRCFSTFLIRVVPGQANAEAQSTDLDPSKY